MHATRGGQLRRFERRDKSPYIKKKNHGEITENEPFRVFTAFFFFFYLFRTLVGFPTVTLEKQ